MRGFRYCLVCVLSAAVIATGAFGMTYDEFIHDSRWAFRVLLYIDGVKIGESSLPYEPVGGSINTVGNSILISGSNAKGNIDLSVYSPDDDGDGDPDMDAVSRVIFRRVDAVSSAPCTLSLYNALDYVVTHTGDVWSNNWDIVSAPQLIACGEVACTNAASYTCTPTLAKLWRECSVANRDNFTGNLVVDCHFNTMLPLCCSTVSNMLIRADSGYILCDE